MAVSSGNWRCCSSSSVALQRAKFRSAGSSRAGVLRSVWLGELCVQIAPGPPGLRSGARKNGRLVAAWEELLHNQVLVSSSVAGLIGQLVKPLTSAISGKGFNLKLVVKPGGMPSTHSAVVTAAATAMGFERGWSDSLFGFTVIVAMLFMYDAQGVRRSVGKQAEVINTFIFTQMDLARSGSSRNQPVSQDPLGVELARSPVEPELKFIADIPIVSSTSPTPASCDLQTNGSPVGTNKSQMNGCVRTRDFYLAAEKLPSIQEGQVTLQELGDQSGFRHIPLKESVGHTKIEVLVGALWGILISFALHAITEL